MVVEIRRPIKMSVYEVVVIMVPLFIKVSPLTVGNSVYERNNN